MYDLREKNLIWFFKMKALFYDTMPRKCVKFFSKSLKTQASFLLNSIKILIFFNFEKKKKKRNNDFCVVVQNGI